ncbi:MAG: hypothetical protein U5K37_05045 [Natrialbaceae archaeon]|nr:hypothetical protein [Natrialbaceae archaeon]
MRIRSWDDLLADVLDRDLEPAGWRAVAGRRDGAIGEDMYLAHEDAGVYQIKSYAKNPFTVRGVGTRVARRVDEDIGPHLPDRDTAGRFGIQQPIEEEAAETVEQRLTEVVKTHAEAPTSPGDFFEDVMDVLESPAFGPMEFDGYGRPEALDALGEQFDEAESLLTDELEDLITDDGIHRGLD